MSGLANHSRLTGMIYPNGRVLTYGYASGLDDQISRVSYLGESAGNLEVYSYLGLDTLVKRSRPAGAGFVELTMLKQAGEADGEAGDRYTGLSRFGQVIDQRWISTSTGQATDRFQYGYDRDGNVLYKNNILSSANSELYHADGASAGYDLLNRLSGRISTYAPPLAPATCGGSASGLISGELFDVVMCQARLSWRVC